MKISIITTVDHNVGDDFVREGIKYLMRQKFSDKQIEFENIHKHSPITARHGFEWFRNLKLSSRVDPLLPVSLTKDRILEADLVVQSGAPVYWCHDDEGGHCHGNEWYEPLIKRRFAKNKNAKLLNLAAGTCQKYHSDGSEFCSECKSYISEFYNTAKVTSCRDSLGKTVLSNAGVDVPVIPCSSIFAKDEHGIENSGEEYVVVNYMKGGAHYTFGQKIDFERWENEFKKFYFELKEKENVIIACHNQKELDAAKELDPEANIFYQKDDYVEYIKFYSKAKFGIMNRVHGAFIMASFGKPSIIIGNDSRARMGSEVGVESIFVNDATAALLNEKYEFLKAGADGFKDKFELIRQKAFDDYMKAFSTL